jgi:hypothetical protein
LSVSASVPEPSEVQTSDRPRLRLVPVHDHRWHLVSVEYDDGLEVRHFECADCGDVLFR